MNSIRSAKPQKLEFADICNLESVFRYKWIALLVFLLGILATFAFLCLRNRSFDSNAKVFIRVGRESVTVDPTAAATGQLLQLSDSQKRAIQSAIDILESDQMMQMLVEHAGVQRILGPTKEPRQWNGITLAKRYLTRARIQLTSMRILEPKNDRADAIAKLKKRIDVKSEADSNVLSLRVRSYDPELSRDLATKLLENFQEAHLKAHRSPGAFAFFSEQLDLTRKEIEECAKQLSDTKNICGITSVHDQRAVLTDKLKAIELANLTAKGEHEGSQARSEELEYAIDAIPERFVSAEVVGLTNTSKDEMRSKLYSLEVELADLSSRFKDEHPQVVMKKKQVEEAKKVLGTEIPEPQRTTSNNPSREAYQVQRTFAKADTASARARSSELESQHQRLIREIHSLNEHEAKIESLERELGVLNAKFQKYSESLEQSRIDEALQAERLSSVNVFQVPTLDDSPVDVSNTIVSFGGLFASFFGAIGATFALRYLRDEMLTPKDVERELQVPVLATIPKGKDQSLQ